MVALSGVGQFYKKLRPHKGRAPASVTRKLLTLHPKLGDDFGVLGSGQDPVSEMGTWMNCMPLHLHDHVVPRDHWCHRLASTRQCLRATDMHCE